MLACIILIASCNTETEVNDGGGRTDSGNDIVNGANDPESSEPAPAIRDSLPDDLDFDGETISIVVRSESSPASDAGYEFYAESEIGDIVNDAIFRRNRTVEERLNINLNVIQGPGWQNYGQLLNSVRASIAAGDEAYDIVAGWSSQMSPLAVQGMFANLHEMPYLELTRPWWNQIIVNELAIAGNLPFVAGDINLTVLGNCILIYYNNNIAQEYGLTDIYDIIFDGKWTLDYMGELAKNVQRDLNGDGIMDENDQFGLVWLVFNYNDALPNAADVRIIIAGDDGMPVINPNTERLAGLVDKTYDLLYNTPGVLPLVEWTQENVTDVAMFNNSQALMVPGYINFAYTFYRETEFDYSVLPYPKYDEAQEKYLTHVQNGMSLLCVPVNSTKKEAIGAFMEAAASESYINVSPVYFETAMKVKYARDEVSTKMLDIIRGGINLNFVSIYNPAIGSPLFIIRSLVGEQKSNNFASWWERNEPRILRDLASLLERMEEMGG